MYDLIVIGAGLFGYQAAAHADWMGSVARAADVVFPHPAVAEAFHEALQVN